MAFRPEIRYLGQSGFHIQSSTSSMLIDPGSKDAGNLPGDIVYCTHKHFDHTKGVKSFLDLNPEAVLIGNEQVLRAFQEFSDRSLHAAAGETLVHGPWSLEFIECKHGFFKSIVNIGIIVRIEDFSFGHGGDTLTFSGFYRNKLDVLAIPISGTVSTTPKSAVEELTRFDVLPQVIVPMHWLFRNPRKFCNSLRKRFPDVNCIVPKDGERLGL
ncbi:MAG: MBL fold metallo-hydrolase [Candidatus Thorarchaeota archaeon]|jgi:L-ascorbate metabolism protein UlaG (beta-lactamase superfamily)